MPLNLVVVACTVTPGGGVTQAIVDMIARAGGEVRSHQWVQVTGSASGGSTVGVKGYNALTVHVQADSLLQLRHALQPDRSVQAIPGVDLNVVESRWVDPTRRKFVVMDVDSTLIQHEVIDLLAAHAGKEQEVSVITDRAMRGEIDFEHSLRERVAALRGLPQAVLDEVSAAIELSPGAQVLMDTLHDADYPVAAVSGGFLQVLEPLSDSLGLSRAAANILEIVDGQLTGQVTGQLVDGDTKALLVSTWAAELGIDLMDVMVVGDGANDIAMARAAGLSVAYRAKPALREVAQTQLSIPNLDALRFFLGL